MRGWVIVVWLVCCVCPVAAQDSAREAVAHTDARLYAGPGDSFERSGFLPEGMSVIILERSRVGNWLRVERLNQAGDTVIDGWVMTGYLALDSALRLSEVPISDLPDAQPARVGSQTMRRLYAVPLLPDLHPSLHDVFAAGQALGNDAASVTKIGDSVSHNTMYLQPYGHGDTDLGPYDLLGNALEFFGSSLSEPSIAAEIGMSTYVVFDPLWAPADRCQPNESPLICEYRRRMPSVALIMFGPNDVRSMNEDQYEAQLRQLLDITLERGIIPVLFTFSCAPEAELWWQCLGFNLRLIALADEYQIPLVNLWLAARTLPDYGLDIDQIHMTNSGFQNIRFSSGHESWFGVSLQNLLALSILDAIYESVIAP